jgi:hypothetical protein
LQLPYGPRERDRNTSGDPQGGSSEETQREGAFCYGRRGRTRRQAAAKTAVACGRYTEFRRRRAPVAAFTESRYKYLASVTNR